MESYELKFSKWEKQGTLRVQRYTEVCSSKWYELSTHAVDEAGDLIRQEHLGTAETQQWSWQGDTLLMFESQILRQSVHE